MKKIISFTLAVVMILSAVFMFAGCVSTEEQIIVHTNAFFAPFEYYDGTEIKGVDVEVMNAVGEKLGKEIVSNALQRSLSNGEHHSVLEIACRYTYQVHKEKYCERGYNVDGYIRVLVVFKQFLKEREHLIVKLSPNVTSIADLALAAEASGADSVSLINTLLGMAIDAEKRRPKLSTVTGGLSGACVKPIALRMVWQVAKAVKIPVIGLGGISSATDAIEFLLAGASAIEIGTANFIDPTISVKVAKGIVEYCERHGIKNVSDLTGALEI